MYNFGCDVRLYNKFCNKNLRKSPEKLEKNKKWNVKKYVLWIQSTKFIGDLFVKIKKTEVACTSQKN